MFPTRPRFFIGVLPLILSGPACLSPKRAPETVRAQEDLAAPAAEMDLLRAICGEGGAQRLTKAQAAEVADLPEETGGAHPRFACRSCPSDSSLSGRSDGPFYFGGAIQGSFSGSSRVEAWVKMVGCAPHAENFGGSYLLRKTGGAWRKIGFEAGMVPKSCLKSRSGSGEEHLICESEWTGQGIRISTLDSIGFKGDRLTRKELLRYGSNVGTGFYPKGPIFDVHKVGWKVEPPKGTADTGLFVELDLRQKTAAPERRDGFVEAPDSLLPERGERIKLNWAWKKGRFDLDRPSSKAAGRIRALLATLGE